MMRLGAFIGVHLGQSIDRDGAFGAQCVDLVNAWAADAAHLPPFAGNANAIAGQARNGWRWTANTPTNCPSPGAIVVWRAWSAAAHTRAHGHCAICVYADPDALITLDQNWNGVASAALTWHPYSGVAGWQEPHPPRD